MTILSERIRIRREQLGYTQIDLAEGTGSTQKQIWLYESGKGSPSIEKLIALAETLQTTTDWLLGLSDSLNHADEGLGLDESYLLELYRNMDDDGQHRLLNVAKVI